MTHIVHSAAELRFDGALDEMRRINVEGVRHLLELARAAHEHHGIARYAHVSTAYVAGGRTGDVAEADLTNEHGFSNTYEQTKYEGEMLVRRALQPTRAELESATKRVHALVRAFVDGVVQA